MIDILPHNKSESLNVFEPLLPLAALPSLFLCVMVTRRSIEAFGLVLFFFIIVAHLNCVPVLSADMVSLPTSVSFYRNKCIVNVCNKISPHTSNSVKRMQQYHSLYRKQYSHPKIYAFTPAYTHNHQHMHSYNPLPRLSKPCVPKSTLLFSTYTPDDNSLDRTTDMKRLITQQIPVDATIYDILHTSIHLLENQSIPE